ncbi:MAG: RNase adapter RapZ [Micrococcales bacterium]|nr:MAG: RNase adapter RapZ [Micrococcales bacterium]PIE26178.1 MAG: RNase adapter RapZ [Micrococcales bacterium]
MTDNQKRSPHVVPPPPVADVPPGLSGPAGLGDPRGRAPVLKPQVLIITGMSGAGRSTTANALEDLGWHVVDNLPPQLLPTLAHMASRSVEALPRVATVMDVRGGRLFEEVQGALHTLRYSGVQFRVLFLDANNEALVRRFESVRRPHPLQGEGRILDGIEEERELLSDLRASADLVVDTSNFNVHQLTARINELFADSATAPALRLTIMSFGFKYGLPVDCDHVVDVRFLPNPYWIPELRGLTGQDTAVADYVLEQPGAREFILRYAHALEPVIEGYRRESRTYVAIAIGCTGGKHRSVAVAEALVGLFAQYRVPARASHRDLGRE